MTGFLSLGEMETIMEAPEPNTWSGRRDRTLLAVLYNTGARVSEIVRINRKDIGNEQCSELTLRAKAESNGPCLYGNVQVESFANGFPR